MTESQWYEVSYAQFAILKSNVYLARKLEARKIKFIYLSSKQENFGETTDMLPFYAYLNRLFRRAVTPRKGDWTKIPANNKNILATMAPNANGFEFSVFDFMWEEIMAISLKSCGYAPYIMHIIERVTARTFFYEKEHHPLRIKNALRDPVEDRRAAARQSSPPRAARGRGQQGDKPPSPIRKVVSLLFGMCKSQHAAYGKAQHKRRERKKITKSVKEIRAHMDLLPPSFPIAPEGEESSKIESFEERIACFDEEMSMQQWYGDVSFSNFGVDYSGMADASSSDPASFESPPLAHTRYEEEEEEGESEDDDE
jgi:hypothetical protein